MMKNKVLNDLFDYGLKIYQMPNYFKFSLDSIILAEYVHLSPKTKNILDLCSGNASIPLILATKTKASITGIELQKEIYDLANASISYNHLNSQITMYNANILEANSFLKSQKYDIITCNPPYFKVEEKKQINEEEILAIARHELAITLAEIFQVASNHLNTKGEFYLVHRASRLDEIIILGHHYKLPVKNITLIKTKKDNKPYIVLVRCVKNGSSGVKINDVINIENYQTYQSMFKEEV